MKKLIAGVAIAVLAIAITVTIVAFRTTKEAAVGSPNPQTQQSNIFTEAARFIAGKPVGAQSTLAEYCKTPYYIAYAKDINSSWDRFQRPNLEKIARWWPAFSPKKKSKTIFYPFSGPDIVNAVTFYPEAETYIMFGLEHPGVFPDPRSMQPAQLTAGLIGLKQSLSTIMQVNYFRTISMEKELGSNSLNSIAGVIMFFLAVNDLDVLDARTVAIDETSQLVPGKASDMNINWARPVKSYVPGVEITFKGRDGGIKKVRYFMLNVIDESLTNNSPNFLPWIKAQAPFYTIIKSASYLMHNDKDKFTQIRAAVLEGSSFLVQDDSGVPVRFFGKDAWKVQYHGVYDVPIQLFAHRFQPDLKEAMKNGSTGVLPFSYGYDSHPGQSNLITAAKVR